MFLSSRLSADSWHSFLVGTAVPGAWGPAPVTLTYQWNANGMPLSAEVKGTYTPMLPVYAISVSVTGTKSGFTTAAKTSVTTEPPS